MPIININGGGRGPSNNQSAPGNGMRVGPGSQIPYMRPDYDKAWIAHTRRKKNRIGALRRPNVKSGPRKPR
jgi:hypothetical protein